MAHVLGIGIATLDILNFVDRYPAEDEELRAHAQQIRRGGNATNTLVVLSQLGHDCAWAGVLAQDADSRFIVDELSGYGIDLSHCRRASDGRTPVSYVTVSRSSGSRTIVHYRDLAEFGYDDFAAMDCHAFDWLHFEGRNVADTRRMLDTLLRGGFPRERVSLEIEKPRDGIEGLFAGPGTLLLSRSFARARGFDVPHTVLRWARQFAQEADLVCAWGEQGAWCLQRDGRLVHGPAVVVPQVVDTVGAGDTFNAGVIDGRLHQCDWPEILASANRLAARKCAQFGFAGLTAATA